MKTDDLNIIDNFAPNSTLNGLTLLHEMNSTWYLGKTENEPLSTCINEAKALKHNFICAFDYFESCMTRPTKIFGSYKNSRQFFKATKNTPSEERCFYVIIPEDKPCCLFGDLEWDLSWKTEQDIKLKFIDLVQEKLSSISISVNKQDFLFASASQISTNKGSLHVHLPTICFNSINDQLRFFNSVSNLMSDDWFFIDETDKSYILKTFIDFGVYNKNRQIRLPYSSKKNKLGIGVRPLIPDKLSEIDFDFNQWTIVNIEYCSETIDVSSFPIDIKCSKRKIWNKDLIQHILDKQQLNVSVETFKGNNLIPLKNKQKARICPINGESNKGDNSFLVIKNNKLHYHCHDEGCKGKSKIIHEFEEDTDMLNERDLSGGDDGLARIFYRNFAKLNIKTTDEKGNGFVWDQNICLWVKLKAIYIRNMIPTYILPILNKKIKNIYKDIENASKDQKKKFNNIINTLEKISKDISKSQFRKGIMESLVSLTKDENFETTLNRIPYELPIKGCKIIDLRSGDIRDRMRTDMYSIELNVKIIDDTDFSNAINFFKSISCDDLDLVDYHRRLWGYCLSGEISDRSLHVCWGEGRNGKSTLMNIMEKILSKFYTSLSEAVMMKQERQGGATPELMSLLHSRLGVLPESDAEEVLNSKRVKSITGADEIKARALFCDEISFRTQTKPIMPTNHKPKFNIDDKAMIDRVKMIPFKARFNDTKKNQKYIKDIMDNHIDEIFTWLCTGAKDWYNGQILTPCTAMQEEMNKYIEELDDIKVFVSNTYDMISKDDYTALGRDDKKEWRCKKDWVYGAYCGYMAETQQKPIGKLSFYKGVKIGRASCRERV